MCVGGELTCVVHAPQRPLLRDDAEVIVFYRPDRFDLSRINRDANDAQPHLQRERARSRGCPWLRPGLLPTLARGGGARARRERTSTPWTTRTGCSSDTCDT